MSDQEKIFLDPKLLQLSGLSKELLTYVGQNRASEIAEELNSLLNLINQINLDQVLNPGLISRIWNAFLSELSLKEPALDELSLKATDLTRSLEESKKKLDSENEILTSLESRFLLCLNEFEDLDEFHMQKLTTGQSLVQLRLMKDLNLELVKSITQTIEETLPLWKSLILTIMKEKKLREFGKAVDPETKELRTSVGEALKSYHESLEKKKVIDQELAKIEQQLLLPSR